MVLPALDTGGINIYKTKNGATWKLKTVASTVEECSKRASTGYYGALNNPPIIAVALLR
jgi:hypothetical protein